MRRPAGFVALLIASLMALVACGSAPSEPASGAGSRPTTAPASPAPVSPTIPTHVLGTKAARAATGPCGQVTRTTYRHVIWIWMENRTYASVLGGSSSPRLSSYARRCGVATAYRALTHPSLPNYLAATSGSTGGVRTDCEPASCPQRRASLFGQIGAAGKQWRGYAEAMSRRCDLVTHGTYAARHNPAVYFTPVRTRCASWDVLLGGATGNLAHALSTKSLPAFSFVTPDVCHDGHDCSTSAADSWLGGWLDRITRSAAYGAGDTAVFVTWDEGVGSAQTIATVVIAPSVKPGTRSATRFTHYSLLRTTEELLGLPLLGGARSATSMRSAFRL